MISEKQKPIQSGFHSNSNADEITKKGLLLPSAVDITISQIDRISKICEKYI